jgi:hypothetical protein
MKYFSFTILFILISVLLHAGTAIDLLEDSVGVRNLAMGGVGVACSEGSGASAYNPAGLALNEKTWITSETSSFFSGELNRFSLNASRALWNGVGGFNFVQEAVNGIPLVRDDGTNQPQQYGSFNNSTRVFNFAYAMELQPETTWIGGNLKFYTAELSTANASGFGADVGLIHSVYDNLQLGLMIRNLLPIQMKWSTSHTDEIPLKVTGGLVSNFSVFSKPLQIAVDIDLLSQNRGSALRAGLEYGLWESKDGQLLLRIGRNSLEQLTFGLGVLYKGFQCDYAYQNHDYGASSSFGLGLQF